MMIGENMIHIVNLRAIKGFMVIDDFFHWHQIVVNAQIDVNTFKDLSNAWFQIVKYQQLLACSEIFYKRFDYSCRCEIRTIYMRTIDNHRHLRSYTQLIH